MQDGGSIGMNKIELIEFKKDGTDEEWVIKDIRSLS